MVWHYGSLLLLVLCVMNIYATLKPDDEPKGPKVTDKVNVAIFSSLPCYNASGNYRSTSENGLKKYDAKIS